MSYIVPINTGINLSADKINWLTDRPSIGLEEQAAQATGTGNFKSVLSDVITNVIETENQTKVDAYNLSIGNMDDMHTMMINTFKAEVALQTMIELRNKMLDAYKEIMNTGV